MLGGLLLIGAALGCWALGLSRLRAWLVLALVWLAMIPAYALGERGVRGWLVIGLLGGAVFAYQSGLRWLRSKIPTDPPMPAPPEDHQMMTGAEIDRYARHLVLREIGGPGQMRLRQAHVLVVGPAVWVRRSAFIWRRRGWAISPLWMVTWSACRTCSGRCCFAAISAVC